MDYKAKTIRFGSALSEDESRQVVEAIKSKFPNMGRDRMNSTGGQT